MELNNAQRADVLIQALPYIQKYCNKIIVVKYGGNAMINQTLKEQVMEDIVLLHLIGVKVVLVHGGGPEISEMMSKLATGISDFAGMKIAKKWDKKGNPIEYEVLTPEKIETAAKNAGDIVKVLAEALINLYHAHPGYFENFWGNASKSEIAKVIKSTEGLGDLIADVAKGIKDIADLSFKDADGKVIKIKDSDLGKDGLIYKRIVDVP